MPHRPSAAARPLTALFALVSDRPWLCSMVYRQARQPGRDIPCAHERGDPFKPVREHESRFRREWDRVLHSLVSACPSAADPCNRLLKLDPLDGRNEAAIADAIARVRHLSDPGTVRAMARDHERRSFGASLRRLRMERGLSLRGLAGACKPAARLLGFKGHRPEHYQIVRYEAGRLGAHPRTVRVIAAALGVPPCELEPAGVSR